jgi:hypothetical protein
VKSRQAIERQLAHFQSGGCGRHGSEENAIWIRALEWVLDGESPGELTLDEWLTETREVLARIRARFEQFDSSGDNRGEGR